MARSLTLEQEQRHRQACQLIDMKRPLTEDEREFVLDHWLAGMTMQSASDRAYFTPGGLAQDMSVGVKGGRIIDLCAGIGRLAFHCRQSWGRWPAGDAEIVCIERNPEYVRVGERVMPEARWIRADIMEIPRLRQEIGTFDCAIGNPPFGVIDRTGNGPGAYRGRRFEYHAIALAALVASSGIFIIPQASAPFRYSGVDGCQRDTGDAEYHKFRKGTGIELIATWGIDTSIYRRNWDGEVPAVEVVRADFSRFDPWRVPEARVSSEQRTEQNGQLSLLAE